MGGQSVSESTKCILVTGSSGFLGSRVTARLASRGRSVVGLDLVRPGAFPGRFIKCDIRDQAGLHAALEGVRCQRIVHLAAMHYIPQCEADPGETYLTNVNGTHNVLNWAEEAGVTSFDYASTADVYAPKSRPHAEFDVLGSPSVYGRSKIEGETLVRRWSQAGSDRRAVIMRLFNLVGSGDPVPHLIPSLIARMAESSMVRTGDLSSIRDYVLVEDVADLIARLRSDRRFLVVNVGNGRGFAGFDVFSMLSQLLGSDSSHILDSGMLRQNDRPYLVADRHRLDRVYPGFPRRTLKWLLMAALRAPAAGAKGVT